MGNGMVTIPTESNKVFGYAGNMLRVNLTGGKITTFGLEEEFLRKYVGGAVLGIKMVYDEVPPGVAWSDPENRLFIGSGPLGGTRVGGSGSFCVVTKGALTNGMSSTQANGIFGAYLRFNGLDAILLEGTAPRWSYLYIHDGVAELRDGSFLAGKTTWEVEEMLRDELHKKHGVQMFRRLIRIHRAEYGDERRTSDFDTWARELSLAAGEDLTAFFRRYGTSVGDLDLPQDSQGIDAVADGLMQKLAETEAAGQRREAERRAAEQVLSAD